MEDKIEEVGGQENSNNSLTAGMSEVHTRIARGQNLHVWSTTQATSSC